MLTLKDFILYNSPCFNCGGKVTITIKVNKPLIATSKLNCNVCTDYTEVDLKISYTDSLSLKIIHTTNVFETNDIQKFFHYLSKNKLHLVSKCHYCFSKLVSSELKFNINNFRAEPLKMVSETFYISDENKVFVVNTDHIKDTTVISCSNSSLDSFNMNMPATPISKFKNKKHFLSKMKTYILFS